MDEMKKNPLAMTEVEIRASDEAYFKLIKRRMELELTLIEKMPAELMELFNEYMDVEIKAFVNESESGYVCGFRNGVNWLANEMFNKRE